MSHITSKLRLKPSPGLSWTKSPLPWFLMAWSAGLHRIIRSANTRQDSSIPPDIVTLAHCQVKFLL